MAETLIDRIVDIDALRHLLQQVFTETLSVGGLLIRYLRLHKPPKHRLAEASDMARSKVTNVVFPVGSDCTHRVRHDVAAASCCIEPGPA